MCSCHPVDEYDSDVERLRERQKRHSMSISSFSRSSSLPQYPDTHSRARGASHSSAHGWQHRSASRGGLESVDELESKNSNNSPNTSRFGKLRSTLTALFCCHRGMHWFLASTTLAYASPHLFERRSILGMTETKSTNNPQYESSRFGML